ncbi:transcription factor grauzone-like [Toxorhynchites rutilus septentrionalis]|uniref:transcription factor grauzone-like n=1 Tax=Toxorhynchites rutilus septentrionalis TaxID=329112 RepID=UPI00247A9433|nr:transcription factor grauzone-like [Toxorhynchites rutilus septentrionalis]
MASLSCRLCGYNSPDLVDLYSDQGVAAEYIMKIGRYLYLLVTRDDDLPKAICWMCSQQLDSFHRFHEKINEIQQRLLVDRYSEYVIKINNRYEERQIGILKHSLEDGLLISPTLPSQQEHDDCTIELIPTNDDDSFMVVNAESAPTLGSSDGTRNENTPLMTANSTSNIEVFEIRKSARKKRMKIEIEQTTIQDEDSGDEIQLMHKTRSTRKPFVRHDSSTNTESNIKTRRARKDTKTSVNQKNKGDRDSDEDSEGDSGDDFPARDSDNEEWPAAETMEKFPTVLIRNGVLTVKGKRLMNMINRFYNIQCECCKDQTKRFKTLPELFKHYKSAHQQEGYVLCCQSKLFRYPAIIMHMARHIQPEAFKCDICGYMVTRPRFLSAHRQTHLPEDQKPYACDHCPKRFCWKRALQVHLNLHKSPAERAVYVCPPCGKTYDTPGGLSAHKKNVHTEPRTTKVSHVCEICANTFATSSGLKEHKATIHQPRERAQLQCPQCSKWLMNSRCLKVHMQLHSANELTCDQCDYKTKKKTLLNRHRITHHQDERPFACDKCNSTFKYKRALTVHIATKHKEGKTSYKCNFCDRTFASSTNFYTHRKNRHPQELAAMKEQLEQEKKLQRIKAGIELDDISPSQESTIIINPDGSRIITISGGDYPEPENTMIVLNITSDETSMQKGDK